MQKMTIQQFRAALTDHACPNGALRAYREITRHPRAVTGIATGDWILWGAVASGWAPWPEAGAPSSRAPAARFAAWGDWSGPPSPAAHA
jgi:hypothetical protein